MVAMAMLMMFMVVGMKVIIMAVVVIAKEQPNQAQSALKKVLLKNVLWSRTCRAFSSFRSYDRCVAS